jgi:hypothetical protein
MPRQGRAAVQGCAWLSNAVLCFASLCRAAPANPSMPLSCCWPPHAGCNWVQVGYVNAALGVALSAAAIWRLTRTNRGSGGGGGKAPGSAK